MSKNSSESHKPDTKCLSVFSNILTGLQHEELVFDILDIEKRGNSTSHNNSSAVLQWIASKWIHIGDGKTMTLDLEERIFVA